MNLVACMAAVLASAAASASAQSFTNLDFDQAQLPGPSDGFYAMPWEQGAPGWSHPDGDSTNVVTYPFGHVGYSQSYVLMPAPFGAASGPYGLGMRGGNYTEGDPSSPVVLAWIAQTGQLGPRVTSIRLLASWGPFALSLNDTPIAMQPVGLDPASPTYDDDLQTYAGAWTGDVSAFAGQVVTLRITDIQLPPRASMFVVDEIQFLPIPEPPGAALLALGLLGLPLAARRRPARNLGMNPARSSGAY
jgi:hypothetical protein